MDRTALVPPGADVELARFEALRAGDVRAFVCLFAEHLPGLRGFARCYVPEADADALVADAVAAFLAGVDVFAWRCTLRAWLYGLLADAGRLEHARRGSAAGPAQARGRLGSPGAGAATGTPAGPADWADLPWGARWGDRAWPTALAALHALPLPAREAVWLRDVAGWPAQEAWDALACTQARGAALLTAGRTAVHDALAVLAGTPLDPDPAVRARQLAAVRALLIQLGPAPGPVEVPSALRARFRRWSAARRRARLLRLGRPSRPVGRRRVHA